MTRPNANPKEPEKDTMAANFKIQVEKKKGSSHFYLSGDFDGSSACELVNTVKEKGAPDCRVTIHIGGIKRLAPFGEAVLDNRFQEIRNLVKCFIPSVHKIGNLQESFIEGDNPKREVSKCW